MPLFVLLEHDMGAAEGSAERRDAHWDFLIEAPGTDRLPTWRLARNPLELDAATSAPAEIPAERLADHRRVYLDYEGEISGNRGRVRRLDRGPAHIERFEGEKLVMRLEGVKLRGRFEIARQTADSLVFGAVVAE